MSKQLVDIILFYIVLVCSKVVYLYVIKVYFLSFCPIRSLYIYMAHIVLRLLHCSISWLSCIYIGFSYLLVVGHISFEVAFLENVIDSLDLDFILFILLFFCCFVHIKSIYFFLFVVLPK